MVIFQFDPQMAPLNPQKCLNLFLTPNMKFPTYLGSIDNFRCFSENDNFYTLDNKFTNKDGEISYSVHMYDRLQYMKGGMKFLKKLTESSKYNFLCGLSQGRSMDKKKWHYF